MKVPQAVLNNANKEFFLFQSSGSYKMLPRNKRQRQGKELVGWKQCFMDDAEEDCASSKIFFGLQDFNVLKGKLVATEKINVCL